MAAHEKAFLPVTSDGLGLDRRDVAVAEENTRAASAHPALIHRLCGLGGERLTGRRFQTLHDASHATVAGQLAR